MLYCTLENVESNELYQIKYDWPSSYMICTNIIDSLWNIVLVMFHVL